MNGTGGAESASGGAGVGGAIFTGGAPGSGGDTTGSGGSGGLISASGGGSSGGASGGGDGAGGTPSSVACEDAFGASGFYATAAGGLEWTSEYWSGEAHELDFGTGDAADPLELANRRGTGTVTVNGDGTLTMSGTQPRIYLATTDNHPWNDVEITVYYQRLEDDNTAYAGLVVGARSGADGHGGDNCTATTYYARFRHDGRADVAKELEHPTAEARATTSIWPEDGPLPTSQWIGMKYIVYNDELGGVRLQVFRDLTEGADGGTWEPIIDSTDNGGWAPTSNCTYEADHIVLEGGGTVFIRNTGTTGPGALYRNLTVRQIDASAPCAE